MKAMMDAFATANFDAGALVDDDGSSRMRKMTEHKVSMVRKLIGMLDADQRTVLAENLEKEHEKGKRGRRGKPGLRKPRGVDRAPIE